MLPFFLLNIRKKKSLKKHLFAIYWSSPRSPPLSSKTFAFGTSVGQPNPSNLTHLSSVDLTISVNTEAGPHAGGAQDLCHLLLFLLSHRPEKRRGVRQINRICRASSEQTLYITSERGTMDILRRILYQQHAARVIPTASDGNRQSVAGCGK